MRMAIREKTKRFSWARRTAEELRRELELFRSHGVWVPEEPGGWWHQYVCPRHHDELRFDPLEQDARRLVCPHGCVLEGEPYRGAWLVFRHQAVARYALQAAALYAAEGVAADGRLAKEILVQYARQFPRYPVHPDAQPWMLKGRAFHQALTEAIWSTTLLRAYLLLKDHGAEFAPDEAGSLDLFFTMLEESMEQYRHILIHEKQNPENNYTAWLNASLASIYAAKGDAAKLEGLLQGEGGFYHHLTIGVKPDGFEFEGSTYYHIFVLRAYLIAVEMAERFGIDLYGAAGEKGQTVKGMFTALAGLSGDSGRLPALHDGPYERVPFAREIAEVFEIGYAVYHDPAYIPVLSHTFRYLYGRPERFGLESLLYGQGDSPVEGGFRRRRQSLLLPDSGFVVLRHPDNPLSVLADFGSHGGSHGHYDKLHISLMHPEGELAPDPGMVPYGSSLRKDWYAHTASHNTVSVGERSQAPHEGRCQAFRLNGQEAYARLCSEGAYEGARLERHLLLAGEWLLDWFHVQLAEGEEQEMDWWYHPAGTLQIAAPGCGTLREQTSRRLGAGDGYGFAEALAQWHNASEAALPAICSTQYAQGKEHGYSSSTVLLLPPGSTLYQIRTPGLAAEPSRMRSGVMVRQRGRAADFVAVHSSGGGPVHVEQEGREDGWITIRIEAAGKLSRFRLNPAEELRPVHC